MSSVLLLKFAAPLQSWGSSSRFNKRMTEREPTKSGVVGLIAAALGRLRDENIDDLAALTLGIRVDQPGDLVTDFHTAHTFDGKQAFVSNRYYLSDAIFLVGIEGDESFLEKIDEAIRNPYFPLFLGRRSCPPAYEISLGIRYGVTLADALRDEPWQASAWYQRKIGSGMETEIVMDAEVGEPGSYSKRDLPLSFDQIYRRYDFRNIKNKRITVGTSTDASVTRPAGNPENETAHDAMSALEDE